MIIDPNSWPDWKDSNPIRARGVHPTLRLAAYFLVVIVLMVLTVVGLDALFGD